MKFGTLNLFCMYIYEYNEREQIELILKFLSASFFPPGPSANFKQRKSKPQVRRL